MERRLRPGDLVVVRTANGDVERRVVAVYPDGVSVCRSDAFEAAERERRPPLAVGFPFSAIVAVSDGPPLSCEPFG